MGTSEILLILLAILVLFGADKLPELARSLGKGLREVKKATDDIKKELIDQTEIVREEITNLNTETNQLSTDPIDEMRKEIEDSLNKNNG